MLSPENKVVLEGVHPTLIPLIFRPDELEAGAYPNLDRQDIPRIAGVICKFSGLLVQAHWFMLKSQKRDQEIPDLVEAILLQIWGGHQKYVEGTAVSVLRETSTASAGSSLGQLVREPEVFREWGRLLNYRERRIKEFRNEATKIDWPGMFARLISALPILGSTEFDGQNFVFGEHKIPTFPFIRQSGEVDNALFLYDFKQVVTDPLIIFEDPYSDYTEECSLEERSDERNKYDFLRSVLGFQSIPQGMVYLFGGGYEPIQNLAFAIARAEGRSCAPALEKLLRNHGENLVRQYGNSMKQEDMVTLLLAEHGPTKILKELLGHHRSLLDDYLKYLEQRTGEGTAVEWQKRIKELIESKTRSIEAYLGLDEGLQRYVTDEIELEANCWGIVTAAGLRIDAPRSYVESIDMRIRMIEEWSTKLHNENYDTYTIGLKIEKLVERTMKFLICFYSGLQSYYNSFERNPDDFAAHEERMLAAAHDKFKLIDRSSPKMMLDEFRTLAGQCSRGMTDHLLGRKVTCNLNKLKDLSPNEYMGIWNRLKHDKRNEVRREEIEHFVSHSHRLFTFFRYGDDKVEKLQKYTLEPIYPMVISFQESHRKRDGLLIYNYEIYSIGDRQENPEIRILTPHEYNPNEEYYCIPFYNRSTKKWWLDPFLMRCSKFDEVLG